MKKLKNLIQTYLSIGILFIGGIYVLNAQQIDTDSGMSAHDEKNKPVVPDNKSSQTEGGKTTARKAPSSSRRQLETLWSHFRGPANGRAFLVDAPTPLLRLAWVLNLSDPNGDRETDDTFFGNKNQTDAIGIAVRADEAYLYLFNVNFYKFANHIFKIRQRDGQLVATADVGRGEPVSNRNSFQLIDAPWGEQMVFKGAFYKSTKIFKIADLTGVQESDVHIKFQGHAQEGQRWGMGRLFLDGRGPHTKGEAPSYYWGSMLKLWHPQVEDPKMQPTVFKEFPRRSIPAQAWEKGKMVLFTRTNFSTPATAVPIFHEHRYAAVDEAGDVLKDVVIEGLYKDTEKLSRHEAGADNNVVQAIALSPDGRYIYAHERPTALTQHIVRRNLEDFSIEGAITSLPSYVNGMWFNGKRRDGMAIGFAIDNQHFYLHTQDEVTAYDLALSRVIWTNKCRTRTLNAAVPYWSSYVSDDIYPKLPNRGTENTIAATNGFIYYTTDLTFEARRASDGELVWMHLFTDLPTNALPGDVILSPGYVFVLTHTNQARLYAFEPATAQRNF